MKKFELYTMFGYTKNKWNNIFFDIFWSIVNLDYGQIFCTTHISALFCPKYLCPKTVCLSYNLSEVLCKVSMSFRWTEKRRVFKWYKKEKSITKRRYKKENTPVKEWVPCTYCLHSTIHHILLNLSPSIGRCNKWQLHYILVQTVFTFIFICYYLYYLVFVV